MGTPGIAQRRRPLTAMSSAGFEGDATAILSFCIMPFEPFCQGFRVGARVNLLASSLTLPSAFLAHMPAASTSAERGKQLHPSPAFNSTLFLHPINNSIANLAMENSQSTNGSRVKRKASATKTKTLPCPHCQRLFARLEHLQRHIR
jgi:hypothetical protein